MEALSDVQREGLWVRRHLALADVLWDRFVDLVIFFPVSITNIYCSKLQNKTEISMLVIREHFRTSLWALKLNLSPPLSRPAWLAALILSLRYVTAAR